jgi:hypothetical protein
MVLSRDFKETVKDRAARDPAFSQAMRDEAAGAFLGDEISARDYARMVELLEHAPLANERLKKAIAALPDTL